VRVFLWVTCVQVPSTSKNRQIWVSNVGAPSSVSTPSPTKDPHECCSSMTPGPAIPRLPTCHPSLVRTLPIRGTRPATSCLLSLPPAVPPPTVPLTLSPATSHPPSLSPSRPLPLTHHPSRPAVPLMRERRGTLEYIVYYIVFVPHNNKQSDMLHHLFTDPALVKLELH